MITGYGCLIITRFPCHFFEVPLESSQNRSLLIAEPIGGINGKPILLATVHLESGDRREARKHQLELILKIISTCGNNMLMGDFNFNSTWKDQQSVITNNGYRDILLELIGHEKFTMAKSPKYNEWRPDKIVIP